MSKIPLFDEFSPVSAKAWKQKIQVDLKGADYNESLIWESPEGIKVKPFYHADDTVELASITYPSTWAIGQSIYVKNPKEGNQRAKAILQKGAEALYLIIPSEDIVFSELMEGIELSQHSVYLELQFLKSEYVKSVLYFAGSATDNVHLNVDIIGNLARSGNWFFNLAKDHEELNKILDYEKGNLLGVDTSLFQNAGANMVQQLAYGLAHANEYLNHFDQNKKVSQTITFKVAVGGNYFFEIAKLRTLRVLWRSLAREYGIAESCTIMAIPSRRNKTIYDYNTNMLRTTTECMSAILGGADMICNMPYDTIYHKNNDFAERIALNQLLLLKNESYFNEVSNAADGAYYIESLTQQLAEKALALFKSIESSGGFLKQLKAHTIQRKIQESASKEQDDFNSGNTILVGTNKYLNEKDRMKETIECYPFLKTKSRKTLIQPILEKRLAEEMEQKRLEDE
jgi:methylmalonyl-CoA mutase